MDARPVLVTGASGYLGEQLLRALLADQLPACGTFQTRSIANLQRSLRQIDLRQPKAVDELIAALEPSTVFHCAAMTDVAQCQANPAAAHANNVEATSNLVEAVSRMAPDASFVFLSTDLVYDGLHPPYNESSPPNPVSCYASTKLQAEALAMQLPKSAVVRTALMFGRRGVHKASFLGWMVDTLAAGRELPLFVDEFRTPIFVDDLVLGLRQIAAQGMTGVWTVGGPQRLSRWEMGEIVASKLGFDRRLLKPARLADALYSAPRPPDVSVDSTRFWKQVEWTPRGFAAAVAVVQKTMP